MLARHACPRPSLRSRHRRARRIVRPGRDARRHTRRVVARRSAARPARRPAARRRAHQGRQAAQRPHVLHPAPPQARAPRAGVARGERRLGARGRRPARPRALRRAHGFNGTKRFPKQAIVDILEKSGVQFGADLNAYTSFDETVYTLQVPTDKPELLDKAISVLRDWADGVTFDPVEVEKERGVVLEEWRLGRGAGMRLFDKQAPVLFHGSKYADRITIGKPEIIKGAPRVGARSLLQRLVPPRPDGGDRRRRLRSRGDIEAQIKSEFATLAPSAKPRPRTFCAGPRARRPSSSRSRRIPRQRRRVSPSRRRCLIDRS